MAEWIECWTWSQQVAGSNPSRRSVECNPGQVVHNNVPLFALDLTCVCRPTLCMVASNYIPRRLGLCWSRVPGLLPVSAASPSMDHEHRTVCQPILEHQIWLFAPSSIISRPICFSSSLSCCWQVDSAPFVRRRCDCSASSAPFTNIQTYLLTSVTKQYYLGTDISWEGNRRSGAALTMDQTSCSIQLQAQTAHDREMSTLSMLHRSPAHLTFSLIFLKPPQIGSGPPNPNEEPLRTATGRT